MLCPNQEDNAFNSKHFQLFEKLTLSTINALRFSKVNAFKSLLFQFEVNVLTINQLNFEFSTPTDKIQNRKKSVYM